jgi:hypothetical protein
MRVPIVGNELLTVYGFQIQRLQAKNAVMRNLPSIISSAHRAWWFSRAVQDHAGILRRLSSGSGGVLSDRMVIGRSEIVGALRDSSRRMFNQRPLASGR